ncbi:transposase [Fusarium oxysporum f. sp. phaseoli]
MNWASNFVKRQLDLKARIERRNDYQRVKCEYLIGICNWFSLIQNNREVW